ncbi:MFS transporter [Azospirillum sp. B4]|uniref:MFS transporter n=1 Tax=Azospirillum sp. B4 TaxID=95605 RepID=UPI0003471236|nr:MFS transporter [Azospirillum sp. B4]
MAGGATAWNGGWAALWRTPLWRAYGAGHFGKSLIWYSSELLFAYFLTEACGLPPRAMGVVLALSLVINGATDMVMGHLLRRLAGTISAAARLHFTGSILAGAALLLFLATGLVPEIWRLGYALVTGLVFRLAYALYDVPQNAVLGMIASERTRTNVSALRFVGAGLATLSIAVIAPVLLAGSAMDKARAFTVFALVLWSLGMVSAGWFWRASRDGAAGDGMPPSPARATRAPFLSGRFPMGLTSILAAECGLAACASVFTRLEPYFAATVLTSSLARGTVMACVALGGLAGQPLWTRVAERATPASAFRASGAMAITGALTFLLFGAHSLVLTAAAALLLGAGLGGLSMLLWAAAGACAVSPALSGPPLAPTQVFGLLTLCIKVGCAMAILVVSEILAWRAGDRQAIVSALGLIVPMAVMPSLGAVLCLLLTPRLRLS